MPRVLIVEDSPTQLLFMERLLRQAGFEVVSTADADEGYARLERERFDVVLTDLWLPGDSGFDLCRRIRADGT